MDLISRDSPLQGKLIESLLSLFYDLQKITGMSLVNNTKYVQIGLAGQNTIFRQRSPSFRVFVENQ